MRPTLALPQTVARAEALRTLCAAPGMNAYQPIAASAVKVCSAAALACLPSANSGQMKTQRTDKLAAYVVDQSSILINTMAHVPVSPDILKALEISKQKLDAIRRHIAQMPGKKTTKFFADAKFRRDTKRLKAELENDLYAVFATAGKMSGASRGDCVLELVSLGTRAAGALCEAPGLNFLKPMAGIAALICDSAKSVKSNCDAAIALAKHASSVTKCIVDRVPAIDAAATDTGDALEALKSCVLRTILALVDIQSHLLSLGRPRRRLAPWIFANREKERFAELSGALGKALAMFMASTLLRTAASSG
ncbi:hypothetical protein B0H17DRAFT_1205401 [Mycena rosella]|uniref:Uncharacterized protein n=1 Tax=Mycena rosella TaxID=1033263 RepID=A0AAD7DAN4_MYCRO|nr:hypothetical protein B0H17DRAFT_1205401 [Mycena rosella]